MNCVEEPLFQDDHGQLSFELRRVLCQLLSGPCLEAERHPKLWPVLLQGEKLIRQRLSDLFLELVLDRELQVAFTRQAQTGELEAPTLLRRTPLTFLDSVLLLYLRHSLIQAENQAERAVVSRSEIQEQLAHYQRQASTDQAGFSKRVQATLEKMKKNNLLQKIRGSEDRFEVSPTLKLLFSAEQVAALMKAYRGISEQPVVLAEEREEGEE